MQARLRALSPSRDNSDHARLLKQRKLSELPAIERMLLRMSRAHRLDRFILQAGLDWTVSRLVLSCAAIGLTVWLVMALVGNTRWTARADVIYQSRRYAEIQNMIWAEPYTRVNLATGVRGKDWRVSLWVKNATDDDTSLNGFRYLDPVTFRRSAVDFLPRLRQVGLTGSIDF